MNDNTDNKFHPSAERIWLYIRLKNASLSGSAIDLQKMPILAKKKKSFLQKKLILILAGNVAECVRKLRTDFGRREALSAPLSCRYLVKKVKETGILIDKPKCEKLKTVGTPGNIAAVAESVCEAP